MELNSAAKLESARCTGCGACANLCSCVTMTADSKGFLHPEISEQCNNCGKCFRHCPVLSKVSVSDKPSEVYAAWSLDEKIRYESTSGGIFSELAKSIISAGGYAAGAKYNEQNLVVHTIVKSIADIGLLRQSKYVQSDTKDIYKQAESVLKTNTPLLFAGTPCQCSGLIAYLNQEYSNLYLCDFICRGVNSPLIYLKYLSELEKQFNSKVKRVWFKNKTTGWNKFGTKIIFENGKEYFADRDTDPFMYGYIKKELNLYMRESCEKCGFKGASRASDITLGDFWGVKLHSGNDNTDGGVSAVILNSAKGEELFGRIKDRVFSEKHSVDEVRKGNVCLEQSAESKVSDEFWKQISRQSFVETINNYKKRSNL
jgi:coenzyme F420-reducing hydrogenase beta subunit